MKDKYIRQVSLLVRCLPVILEESCFAIKGGTAINLFCFDMPRLSVDIDLVYLPLEDRKLSYAHIKEALVRIADRLKRIGYVTNLSGMDTLKLILSDKYAEIKIEPNYTLRGHLFPTQIMELCEMAQKVFGYAEAQVISEAELWGGKICAALDRQHPRDLFDIAHLFKYGGITDSIKQGFMALLLQGNRPVHEMLNPRCQLTQSLFDREFLGMSNEPFVFSEAMDAFKLLTATILKTLTDEDKKYLMDFISLRSDCHISGLEALNQFPGIQWKKLNLERLRNSNPEKFNRQCELLSDLFE